MKIAKYSLAAKDLRISKTKDGFDKEYIDECVAVIVNAGIDNYYHWLLQVFPGIYVLKQSGIPFDKLYFGNSDLSLPFQKNLTLRKAAMAL